MKFLKNSMLTLVILSQPLSGYAAETATLTDIAQLQSQLDSLSAQIESLTDDNNLLTATVNNQQFLINDLSNENDFLVNELTALQLDTEAIHSNVALLPEVPVGTILAWHKDQAGIPSELGDKWVICDGQTIIDPESVLYGQETPDLVGDKYEPGKGIYLRGGHVSGVLNESTQITDNTARYSFSNFGRYYGAALFSINNAEDFVGSNNAPNAFYSEHHRVRATFQVAAMTVVWIMKIK